MDFTSLLPVDLFQIVWLNLSLKDIQNCLIVCKRWLKLLKEDGIWRKLIQRDYGEIPIMEKTHRQEYLAQEAFSWDAEAEIEDVSFTNNNRTITLLRKKENYSLIVLATTCLTKERPYFEIKLKSAPTPGFAFGIIPLSVLQLKTNYYKMADTIMYSFYGFITSGNWCVAEKMYAGVNKRAGICVDFENYVFHIFLDGKYSGTVDFPISNTAWESQLVPCVTFCKPGSSVSITYFGNPPESIKQIELLPIVAD